MITVLTGNNEFALKQAIRTKKHEFVATHGDFSVEEFAGDEVAFDALQAAVESVSFLAPEKLVIIKSLSENKLAAENIEKLAARTNDTTELLVVEPKVDKRTSYYKWVKKHADFHEFTELDDRKLAAWAVEYAKEQGGSLTPADANYLISRVGNSQQKLASELDKLSLQGGVIVRERIDALTEPNAQSKIFDLLDAAFAGRTKQAILLYQEQRSQRVEPQEIMAMIGWQLRQVALAKTAGKHDLVHEGKVSPYGAGKAKTMANRLTLAKLKQLVYELTALDAKSKRVPIDIDEALQNYILILAQ